MTRQVPKPVLNFFARFLANPDCGSGFRGQGEFMINLLDLEIDRAEYNVLTDPPTTVLSDKHFGDYRADVEAARRVLRLARKDRTRETTGPDLRRCWLVLLGHRIASERDLEARGLASLAHVAAARLTLPEKETETWSEEEMFRRYTRTVLRDEWDYPGIQFRYPRSAWPPEAGRDA